MINISPAYSLISISSVVKQEKVRFFDSSGCKMKLFSETLMQSDISPEVSIFVIVGLSKSFVIVIFLEAL